MQMPCQRKNRSWCGFPVGFCARRGEFGRNVVVPAINPALKLKRALMLSSENANPSCVILLIFPIGMVGERPDTISSQSVLRSIVILTTAGRRTLRAAPVIFEAWFALLLAPFLFHHLRRGEGSGLIKRDRSIEREQT